MRAARNIELRLASRAIATMTRSMATNSHRSKVNGAWINKNPRSWRNPYANGMLHSRPIPHAHEGEVQVQSEIGRGSLFEVRLPATN